VLATRRGKAAQAQGSILSNVTPSGAYQLSDGAVQSYIDEFNSNSDQPYAYIRRNKPKNERTVVDYFKGEYVPQIKKVILPRTKNTGQMTASEAYNLAAEEGMELMPWLQQLYKDLGLSIEDYLVDINK
jgi:hypothetical protein